MNKAESDLLLDVIREEISVEFRSVFMAPLVRLRDIIKTDKGLDDRNESISRRNGS